MVMQAKTKIMNYNFVTNNTTTILCITITQQLLVILDLTQLIHAKKDPRECKAPIRGEAQLLGQLAKKPKEHYK